MLRLANKGYEIVCKLLHGNKDTMQKFYGVIVTI